MNSIEEILNKLKEYETNEAKKFVEIPLIKTKIIGKIKYNYNNIIVKYDDENKFLNAIKDAINYMGINAVNVTCFSKELGKKVDEIYLNEFGI